MSQAIASPLSVILEQLDRGSLERALFVSYTFDAGYFEQVALGPLEATGARIVVISDAAQTHLDPYAARRIGRRYAVGLVHHRYAFHPKLVVLQSAADTTIGIGSANVTMSGWHSNEELWSFISATPDEWPALATGVGRWLQHLSGEVSLGPRLADFVSDLGQVLDRKVTSVDGLRFVNNANSPILSQLPEGPVDELNIYSPFHDAQAKALRSVVERFQPSILRLGFQPGSTRLDGQATRQVLDELACTVELRQLPTERYRHGKLIEWSRGGRWSSLTGSPNLSLVALDTTTRDGNYEIGLITNNPEALLPDGVAEGGSQELMRCLTPSPGRTPGTGLEILEATLEGDVVLVRLTAPAPTGVTLEVVPAGSPPDRWEHWARVGSDSLKFEVPALAGGSWVRLRLIDGQRSAARPVIGPNVFQHRPSVMRNSQRLPKLEDLIDDQGLAEQFLQQLSSFRDEISSGTAPSLRVSLKSVSTATPRAAITWEGYLERAAGRLGEELVHFALGLPTTGGGSGIATTDWDEELAENDVGLEDEDAESLDGQDLEGGSTIPDTLSWSEKRRVRVTRWLDQLPDLSACDEPMVRLLALRLTLTYLAGSAWRSRDRSWVPILLRHLEAIASTPVDDAQIRGHQGALAALVMSILRSTVPRFPVTVDSSHIDRVGRQLAPLLGELDDDALTEYCRPLHERLRTVADPTYVLELVLDMLVEDPISDAIDALANFESGIPAYRYGDILVIPKEKANPTAQAFLALRMLGATDTAIIQVGKQLDAVVLAWARPTIYVMRPMTNGQWRAHVYRLPGSFGPETYSRIEELPSSEIVLPNSVGWPAIIEHLDRLGIDATSLPPVDC